MLQGKKTFIFGGLAILSVVLRLFNLIDSETMAYLLSIFIPAEGMALRDSIKKLEK